MNAEDLIARRRDRSIAHLLGMKERELDQFLPIDVQTKYRKAVLDTLNGFYDAVIDVLRSVDDGTVVLNELYLDKLDAIYESLIDANR